MKVRNETNKETGKWQILEIARYEAMTLSRQAEALREIADGHSDGIVIGGINFEIRLAEK